MHAAADLPRVNEETPLTQALVEIMNKRLGMTTVVDAAGRLRSDTIGLADELRPGRPMLQPVMRAGRRLQQPSLDDSRAYARREIDTLPLPCRSLHDPEPVAPALSAGLRGLADRVDLEFP
jgi:hypothetical protein